MHMGAPQSNHVLGYIWGWNTPFHWLNEVLLAMNNFKKQAKAGCMHMWVLNSIDHVLGCFSLGRKVPLFIG